MATKKSNATPSGTTSNTGGKLKRMLIVLLALIVAAGASAAGMWLWMSSRHAAPPATVSAIPEAIKGQQSATPVTFVTPPAVKNAMQVPAPIFIPLEAFTIMLQDGENERMLHLAITLRTSDEQTRERIEKYLPLVRSRILMLLSAQTPKSVQSQQGKLDLAKAILNEVNLPFPPLPDGQYVTDVLFTAFVVQ